MNKSEKRWLWTWMAIGAWWTLSTFTTKSAFADIYLIAAVVSFGIGQLPGAIRKALKQEDN